MQDQNNIHDIIAELAMVTDLPNGPTSVLERLKSWCLEMGDKVVVSTGQAFDLNNNLTRTKYSINYDSGVISLSFLFHKLSQRWYIDRLEPQV